MQTQHEDDAEHAVRLFLDTLGAMILDGLSPAVAVGVMEPDHRAWLSDLAVLTGLPAAAGRPPLHPEEPEPVAHKLPTLVFAPSPGGLAELRSAHAAARRALAGAADPREAADARGTLAVLAAVGRALRLAGLWPAYLATAQRLAGRSPR
jgi:hypothetical protein